MFFTFDDEYVMHRSYFRVRCIDGDIGDLNISEPTLIHAQNCIAGTHMTASQLVDRGQDAYWCHSPTKKNVQYQL